MIYKLSTPQGEFDIEGPDNATDEQLLEVGRKAIALLPQLTGGNLDTDTGAPAGERAAASFMGTAADRLAFWKTRYPDARYVGEEIEFTHPQSGRTTRVNPIGLDWGDVASMAGSVPATVGSLIGAVGGGAPSLGAGSIPGAMAGSAAGEGVRQAVGSGILAASGGLGEAAPGERLTNMGVEAAFGGVGQWAGNKIARLLLKAPTNVMGERAAEAAAAPIGREGAQLVEETRRLGEAAGLGRGVELTTGQRTGQPFQERLEDMARQHPWSSDAFAQRYKEQMNTAVQLLDKEVQSFGGGPIGQEEYGAKAIQAFDKALDTVLTNRREQAAVDFARVGEAGGKLPTRNMQEEVGALIDEFDAPAGGATKHLVGELKKLRAAVSKTEDGAVDPAKFNRLLQIWGGYAQGRGKPFLQIDAAQQRMVAGRVFGALNRDLDLAATTVNADASAAEALRTARANYRANSAPLDEIRKSSFGRIFDTENPVPEKIAERVYSLAPSELRTGVKLLEKYDPETLQATRRFYLEKAMQEAETAASSTATGARNLDAFRATPAAERDAFQVKFSAAKFVSEFNKLGADRVDVLFGGEASRNIRTIAKALERVASTPGANSQTFTRSQTFETIKTLLLSATNPSYWPSLAANTLIPGWIQKRALTDEGRRALTRYRTTPNFWTAIKSGAGTSGLMRSTEDK